MADAPREVKCLLLPLAGTPLIVPNTAVAEIITQQDTAPSDDTPDWYLGTGAWRGAEIPLIAFDCLCGDRPDVPEAAGRFAVLYGIGGNDDPAFYGVRIESLPRTETAAPERLSTDPAAKTGDFIAARVRVDGRECAIPDLDALERAVAACG